MLKRAPFAFVGLLVLGVTAGLWLGGLWRESPPTIATGAITANQGIVTLSQSGGNNTIIQGKPHRHLDDANNEPCRGLQRRTPNVARGFGCNRANTIYIQIPNATRLHMVS